MPIVTKDMLSEEWFQKVEEEILNAEIVDDSEELIDAYFDEIPILFAEIRRLRKLLDDAGIRR